MHPKDLIHSDLDTDEHSDDHSARLISVQDRGSRPKYARVAIQDAPCLGIIDTGSDITIIGGYLFKKLVSRMQKKDLKQPDKTPLAYNQQPFKLHGQMDLRITFWEKTMVTPVYIKMDAHDQLLLSEGVCRQLDIVRYHPDVDKLNGEKKRKTKGESLQVHLIHSFYMKVLRCQ